MCKSVYMTDSTDAIANLELVSECVLSSTRLTKVRWGTLGKHVKFDVIWGDIGSFDVLPRSVCVTDGTAQLFGAFVGSGRGESCTICEG